MSNFIYEFEDQTYNLSKVDEDTIVRDIVKRYNALYDARKTQIDETNMLRDEIYQRTSYMEDSSTGFKRFNLPELTELAQTFEAHLYENVYKLPENMFDCQGEDEESQAHAATQKTMLVNAFSKMDFHAEMEKLTKSIVDSGEAVLYVTWQKKVKKIRRKKTVIEKLKSSIISEFTSLYGGENIANIEYEKLKNCKSNYVEFEKLIYDGVNVKCLDNLEFVFDPFKSDDIENADMMYRTHKSYDEILCDRNYTLSPQAKEDLKHIEDEYNRDTYEIKKDGDKDKNKDGLIELIEYWGNIKVNKATLRNYLIVIANGKHIIRFESNPYVHKPFIYGNVFEDPDTRRGISPLRVAKSLNDISSEILSKQVYSLDLAINPPWLSPKKMLSKDVLLKPGQVIEFESNELAQTPLRPERLDFSKSFSGFEFISYFKSLIENATGMFKNMVGAQTQMYRTATETRAVIAGQSARQNQLTDKIYARFVVPMVKKVADTIANEKFGTEQLFMFDQMTGKGKSIEITDETRNGNYRYIYADSKANNERVLKFKDNLAMIKEFMNDEEFRKKTDIIELFKLAMEQLGFDNVGRFIYDDQERIEKNIADMRVEKVVQESAKTILNGTIGGGNQGFIPNNGQMGMPQNLPQAQTVGVNQQG